MSGICSRFDCGRVPESGERGPETTREKESGWARERAAETGRRTNEAGVAPAIRCASGRAVTNPPTGFSFLGSSLATFSSMSRRATARPNTTAHQAVGSLRRATEEPAAGEKRQMNSLADDRPHGWEPLQVRTREEKRGRAVAQREETQGNITVRQHAVHEQQLQRVKEEHVGERLRPGAQPNSVLTTAPALRRDGLPPCRPSLQSEEAGRVDWAALQVGLYCQVHTHGLFSHTASFTGCM